MNSRTNGNDGWFFTQKQGDLGEWFNLRHARRVLITRQSRTEHILKIEFADGSTVDVADAKTARQIADFLDGKPAKEIT